MQLMVSLLFNLQCIDNVHFNDLFHGTLNDSSSVTMPHSIRYAPCTAWIVLVTFSELSN